MTARLRLKETAHDLHTEGGGWIKSDKMYTLNTTEVHAVCYRIGSFNQEGMKSDNPKNGFFVTEVANTLDLNGANPGCYQGGIAVVEKAKNVDHTRAPSE